MVDALRDGLVQATPGAPPRGFVQDSGFGLHTGDEETHRASPSFIDLWSVFELPWLADDFSNAQIKPVGRIFQWDACQIQPYFIIIPTTVNHQ